MTHRRKEEWRETLIRESVFNACDSLNSETLYQLLVTGYRIFSPGSGMSWAQAEEVVKDAFEKAKISLNDE
jgi:hypothetical protein